MELDIIEKVKITANYQKDNTITYKLNKTI